MSPSEIEDILAMQPFKPLRFTLSSGDKLVVDQQFKAMVAPGGEVYLFPRNEEDPAERRRLRVLSSVNIAMIERLESVPPAPTSRRRRR